MQNTKIKQIIPQTNEIMKARINRFDENLIAVKTGGFNAEYMVYDLRNQ